MGYHGVIVVGGRICQDVVAGAEDESETKPRRCG